MSHHPLEDLVDSGRFEGPLSVIHSCPLCAKVLQTRRKGGGGRGQGMRMGNIGRGLVIQHLKTDHANHPKVLAAYAAAALWKTQNGLKVPA